MNNALTKLLYALPDALRDEIENVLGESEGEISEIRLRVGHPCSLTMADGESLLLRQECDFRQMRGIICAVCGGSVHAHSETMRGGYIAFDCGDDAAIGGSFRVGICGRAVIDGGNISDITDITSVCIRIPPSEEIMRSLFEQLIGGTETRRVRSALASGGALFFSRPGGGKTTALKLFASALSMCGGEFKPMRTVLIDGKRELYDSSLMRRCLIDRMTDFPKAEGITFAVQNLSPELIVCDEIGTDAEAAAVLSAQNVGIPLIASAHAGSRDELLRRVGIRKMIDGGVFSAMIGLSGAPDYRMEFFDL